LTKVADSVIGDVSERGISGGEKKRVSVGMELVADPAILFVSRILFVLFYFILFLFVTRLFYVYVLGCVFY
jgi:hypothetical protein